MLYGPQHKLKLIPETIEAACLSASHEFYDNASSGNYNTGDMKLAYEWYSISSLYIMSLLKYNLAWGYHGPPKKSHKRRNSSKPHRESAPSTCLQAPVLPWHL